MTVNALLSTVILIAFIVTIVLAVGSYLAYKLRERRRPAHEHAAAGDEPVYFERFFPQGAGAHAADGSAEHAR